MLTLALVTALCLSACSDSVTEDTSGDTSNTDTETAPPNIAILRIEGPSSIEIELGSTHQLVIDHPSEVLSHVVWQVTEGNSVTVDGEGKLTASALGTSTVKASYGALSDTVKVTVVEATHEHTFTGGKCECGENDPTYVPPHTHSFVNGKCECGESDPGYVPDTPPSGDDSGSGNTGSGTTTPSGSTSTAGVVINGETIPEYDGKSGYYVVNGNTPFFTETDKAFTGYKYSPLDSLGRATGAFARLTVSLCPTDERDSISHIKPTGWSENTTYASVGASPLYNRSHLLAHSIMSDDVHHENMISGTAYMNQTVMTTFEDMVRDIVKSGSDVLYRVTPIFLGDNLIAHGVLIEAYSIEDGGEDICICVYLYNVHPGVVIDYATGKSWLENSGSGDTDEDEDTVRGDVIFNFGEKGATGHNDGSTIGTTKTYTVDGYSLVVSNASKVFAGARDDLGNTCLKLGTGDTVASFSFTVASNVEKVYIKIAGYKSSNAVVAINGKTYTVTTHSNDGKYTVIEVDTTSAKTVTIATQSSGKRAMIDSIEYVIAK